MPVVGWSRSSPRPLYGAFGAPEGARGCAIRVGALGAL